MNSLIEVLILVRTHFLKCRICLNKIVEVSNLYINYAKNFDRAVTLGKLCLPETFTL